MFARLGRLFRAWLGHFVSMAEDPEVMLEDAIEEMRTTMPKLNSVLVATRATVIRLEEERKSLAAQERELASSIQAALRDGTAEARTIAEEDALQLQQVRVDLQSTDEQLLSARKAHEASQLSVEALKAKLKQKIETSQRAIREHQKARVMKSAADAIVELQSYGVASTADKFLEQIRQEVAESKAAVEIATGAIDSGAIERERAARRIKASSILQQFEVEMGLVKPAASAPVTPTVGNRTGEQSGV